MQQKRSTVRAQIGLAQQARRASLCPDTGTACQSARQLPFRNERPSFANWTGGVARGTLAVKKRQLRRDCFDLLARASMPKFGKMRLSKKELQIKTLRSAERQLEEIRRKAVIRMRFLVCRFHLTAQYAIVMCRLTSIGTRVCKTTNHAGLWIDTRKLPCRSCRRFLLFLV